MRFVLYSQKLTFIFEIYGFAEVAYNNGWFCETSLQLNISIEIIQIYLTIGFGLDLEQ